MKDAPIHALSSHVDKRMVEFYVKVRDNIGFVPPMDVFEPFEEPTATLAGRILGQALMLANKADRIETLYSWLDSMIQAIGPKQAIAIYGKGVYGRGTDEPSDIDMLFFMDGTKNDEGALRWRQISNQGSQSGNVLHGQQIVDAGCGFGIGGWTTLCVVNGIVLLPMNPDESIARSILTAREEFRRRDFIGGKASPLGGIGELITYAMTKVLEGNEGKYLDPHHAGILDKFSENIWCISQGGNIKQQKKFIKSDGSGESFSPSDFNTEARQRIRNEFGDDEIRILAKAAMRRIRVRKERQEELAGTFVKCLPKKRAAFSLF